MAGAEHEVVAPNPTMPNIVSEFSGGAEGERLIFNGHIDVFPVGDAAGWSSDPWSGEHRNGRVHGRGTVDMKAGTAASIIAYTYLRRFKEHLRGSVGLTVVSDEETGGHFGAKYLLDSDPRWLGDCMLNGEPGGLNSIRFAEKGTLRLTFEVKTPGAHGAYVHRSESATIIAAMLIMRLSEVEGLRPALPENLAAYLRRSDVRERIDQVMGPGTCEIITKPTLNIGKLNGGLKVNMIPDRCVFEADIRLPVGLDAREVLELIGGILKGFPQVTMSVQEAASNPANVCAHDHRMVRLLANNAKSLTSVQPLAVPGIGATDCKFWRYRKVPAFVYGPSPAGMAMANESVSVDEFITVLKTQAMSAWDFLART